MSELPTLYKFLTAEMGAPTGRGRYTKARWRSVRGGLMPCANGLHATTADNLVPFIDAQLWRCEAGDEYVWHEDAMGRKLVARRLRIVERVEAWNERSARLFAADCAERVLPLYEAQHPNDGRPRRAIETARAFANGEATAEGLAAARAAAQAAAQAAAWDAAQAAARDAAWAAAQAAAWDAAWAAAQAAARDAAWAAAQAAARDAAWAAAWAAALAAARDAERRWQNDHLSEMLGLGAARE